MTRRLYKIERGRKIFGVCGGLAEYFNIDVSIVRIAWVLLVLCGGTGFFAVSCVRDSAAEQERRLLLNT
jgi:phage shock protein PspC (stress-responsive transcriptional regulator)